MTLPEHVGKVASDAVSVMRGSPALMAVIVLQLATLAVIYGVSTTNSERQQERETAMFDILRTCHLPPDNDGRN